MNIVKVNVNGNIIFLNIVNGDQTSTMPDEYSTATREEKREAVEEWRKIKYADGRKKSLYNNNEIPNEFLCPITEDIMEDPVIADDNFTYDRANIIRWFRELSSQRGSWPNIRYMSPMTREYMSDDLRPNRALKNRIDDWKAGPPQFEDMEGGSFDY